MRNHIYSTCIGLLLTFTASATDFFSGSFDEAIQKAKQENKKVLLYFTAGWCGPCHLMDKTVYPSDSVSQLVGKEYIALKINIDSHSGEQLQKQYTIVAVPSFLIIDYEANVIRRRLGFLNVRKMFDFLTFSFTKIDIPKVTLSDLEIKKLEYKKESIRSFQPEIGALTGINCSTITNNSGNERIGSQFVVFVSMENGNVYRGRFLLRPGIGYISKGNKSNIGHFLNIPVDLGYTFFKSALFGLPGGFRIIGSPYYSVRLNKSSNFNKSDFGFRSGISAYVGETSKLELILMYDQGLTDSLNGEAGVQRNQLVSISFGITI